MIGRAAYKTHIFWQIKQHLPTPPPDRLAIAKAATDYARHQMQLAAGHYTPYAGPV